MFVVWFMTIRGILITMFSNKPEHVAQREELERWMEHDIKGSFKDGYNNPRPTDAAQTFKGRERQYQVFSHYDLVKMAITFILIIAFIFWIAGGFDPIQPKVNMITVQPGQDIGNLVSK